MKKSNRVVSFLLALTLVTGLMPADAFTFTAFAANTATGVTQDEPFPQGTAGSNSFRIPVLVTLSDGTLVAAADARWNTTYDGGGLDTIVSRSTDNGASWTWSWANYLDDNGESNEDVYNGGYSAFLDPALVVDANDTIYMLVDLYPYGVALNGGVQVYPEKDTGFNANGKLLLSGDDHKSYAYYLDNGKIYSQNGTAVPGYEVDDYFNITGTDGTNTNLFFSDSPYKVQRTGYLYLTKSTDKGVSWSKPTLLNLKTEDERVCLVAPGRGLVTDDLIIFPCYSYDAIDVGAGTGIEQYAGFIYSDDGGATWKRTSNFTGISWSSESAVVELSDGTLRFFFRNGTSNLCYVDYNLATSSWGTYVNTGISTNSNCQISAITYSKTVDGKQVILVSCPTGPNEAGSNQSGASYRLNGKIFMGLVENDKTITWQDSHISVTSNNNQFMYSCLTEQKDGTLAILYEDKENAWGAGDTCYYTMSYAEYDVETAFDVTLDENSGDADDDADPNTVTVRIPVGGTAEFKDETGNYEGTPTAGLNTSIATVTLKGTTTPGSSTTETTYEKATSISPDSQYYIYDGNGNYLVLNDTTIGTTTEPEEATLWDIVGDPAQYTISTQVNSRTYYLRRSNNNTLAVDTQTQNSEWKYNNSNGFYYETRKGNKTTTYYLYYNNNSAWAIATNVRENFGAPYVEKEPPDEEATDITFTGVAPGKTAVQIGNITYNITVYAMRDITVIYSTDGTDEVKRETKEVMDDEKTLALDEHITGTDGKLYQVSDPTLTLTAENTYTVMVTEVNGTPITIQEKDSMSLDMGTAIPTDGSIKWTVSDGFYAGVAGDYNTTAGAYGNTATLIGRNETQGSPVAVVGTIYDEDGNVVSAKNWLVTVTPSTNSSTNTTTKYIYIEAVEITNCDMYYSVNAGPLIKVNSPGIIMDQAVTGGYQFTFFCAPHDGYILSAMKASNSKGEFFYLADGNPDGTGSTAWPYDENHAFKNNGFRWGLSEGNFTEDQLRVLFAEALSLGCKGAICFTKNNAGTSTKVETNEHNLVTQLSFIANAKPIVEKTLNGILPDVKKQSAYKRYEGVEMLASVGDYVYFTLAVTISAPKAWKNGDETTRQAAIEYSNFLMEEQLDGAYFYTKDWDSDWNGIIDSDEASVISNAHLSPQDITEKVNDLWTNEELAAGYRRIELFAVYPITQKDLDLDIINTIQVEYDYSSVFTAGSGHSSGEAEANIHVTGRHIDSIVVDFGLPVSITDIVGDLHFRNIDLEYTNTKADGFRVKVELNAEGKYVLTCTLTDVLRGPKLIQLYDSEHKTVNSFYLYPATTVLYSAGRKYGEQKLYVDYDENWVLEGTENTGKQAHNVLGSSDAYGYSAAYTTVGLTNGLDLYTTTLGAKAFFTFTGTGVEVYANCSIDTGTVLVEIWNTDGAEPQLHRSFVVDTVLSGDDLITNHGNEVFYHLPIVSVLDLPYGNYKVELTKVKDSAFPANPGRSGKISLDAFRVFGTIQEPADITQSPYYKDQEDNPSFYELRDFVLGGLGVQNLGNWGNLYAILGNQIFNKGDFASGAIVLDAANTSLDVDVENLLMNGPKNELFLKDDQTLVFKVTTDRLMQIGLKAPQGQTSVEVSVTYDGTPVPHKVPASITSSVDMFYELGNENGTERIYTITITNNGPNILSVTKLKICDDPDASFGTLTEEDVANVLVDQGLMPQRTDKDATVRVSLQDYAGNQVGAVTLSKRGADGRRVTFTAAEVLAAARQQMPEGYDFVNKEAVFDVTATYGESREAYVQVGKVATVNITYISLSKRKVYTITVTKIQFAEGDCQLSVTELMHYSPLGRFLLMMSGITAEYGAETDVVVTVL